jgi:hypothetical protein
MMKGILLPWSLRRAGIFPVKVGKPLLVVKLDRMILIVKQTVLTPNCLLCVDDNN